jgi:hypothetical protein
MKSLIWVNRILLAFFILFSMLGIAGRLVFGHGLGDLFYYLFVWVVAVVFIIFSVYEKKQSFHLFLFTNIVFALILIYLVYLMTAGRGPEYPWNGKILYPSTPSYSASGNRQS